MKQIYLLLLLVFSFLQVIPQRIVILHTNDMHSNLNVIEPKKDISGFQSIEQQNSYGGFSRLSTLIKQERQKNPDNTLVLDAGDFLMGTIFHTIENETSFQIRLMKEIGYDYVTLGNHEFDMGPNFLAQAINDAYRKQQIPKILASQMIFDHKSTEDDLLEELFNNGVIKPYEVFEFAKLKIGIFGIIGNNAIFAGVGAKPVKFADKIKVSKNIVKILKQKEKCDIIICLSHTGIYQKNDGVYYYEDVELANKVKDIDIIISGHTHTTLSNYARIGKTIIVQTGAYLQNVGRLEVEYKNDKVEVIDYRLIQLDSKIKIDEHTQNKIDEYLFTLNDRILVPQDLDFRQIVANIPFELRKSLKNKESGNLGDLIADAVWYYTNKYSTGTDLTLLANGTIRDNILPGAITPFEIFKMMPLGRGTNDFYGSSLAKIYLTGNEIKKLFEVILLASKPGEDSYLFWSGVEVEYNPNGGFLNKVRKVYIGGKQIDISKKNKQLYSLTANLYLLEFVGDIKKISKGLIVVRPKDVDGKLIENINKHILDFDLTNSGIQEGKEWIAVVKYLISMPKDKNGIPTLSKQYSQRQQRLKIIQNK